MTWIVGVALVVLAAEAAWLWRRRPRVDWVWTLVAGAGLLGALQAALVDAPAPVILAALAVGGLGHAADVRRRFL